MEFNLIFVIGIVVGFALLAYGVFRAATSQRTLESERAVQCNECLSSTDPNCASACGMPT